MESHAGKKWIKIDVQGVEVWACSFKIKEKEDGIIMSTLRMLYFRVTLFLLSDKQSRFLYARM